MSSIDPIKHRDDPALEKSAKTLHQQRRNRPNKRETERSTSRLRHGFWTFRHSALTRRIVIFNLIALNCLIAAALYFSSTRESLVFQRSQAMVVEAELAANIISLQMAHEQAELSALSGLNNMLAQLRLSHGSSLYVFADKGTLIGEIENMNRTEIGNVLFSQPPQTPITDGLSAIWSALKLLNPQSSSAETGSDDQEAQARNLIGPTLLGQTQLIHHQPGKNSSNVTALTPIYQLNAVVGVVALVSPGSQIDALVKSEQERTLQLMLIGTLFSIFLSGILASSISNPLRDLANAAELGREKNAKNVSRGRIRIPDLSDRTDEIGRLSSALRGMVEALYDRIESNEQFAADVAHEIKNPLASLRSAVGTLQRSKREDHRTKLLEVIDHDVRRLDRLVSDISNASRLDSELVKEDQETFDLLALVRNLAEYLGAEAQDKGIDFISDFPDKIIHVRGLEARLAQVFVNLISNAISFCQDGDAIRIWVRVRENRVLVVVEDTGPGIPQEALSKVFNRFYSERPASEFGNNSGLGLAISKQIIEAHDGVIWAENIHPTLADADSEPLGARFVVGLPI
tara:strand:- start:835 stop:2553 length:1719 start_codon:yes stop_codon:yes gene_type:complete